MRLNREDLFVDAYIRNRFNGTQAALETFDLGSNGGQQISNTASALASEYLRKPKVQEKLRARMQQLNMSPEWVMERYKQVAAGKPNQYTLPALDRLAHIMGIEVRPVENGNALAQSQVQIILGLPIDSPPQGVKTEAIDTSSQ